MKYEVNPKDTKRAKAFELWMKSPMPMVTVVKTFDVTPLYRVSRRSGKKFNMLLCWCIGRAASQIEEFYLLPERLPADEPNTGVNGKLYRYDRLAINVIVDNVQGGISNCDVPYSDDLEQFSHDYDRLTQQSATTCNDIVDDGAMVVGTSAVTGTELDCIVNQYTGIYKRHWFRKHLTISLQFHHAQMDGRQVALFLEGLQRVITSSRR